ncbi:hypothetical protein L0337_17035 [candidate division KSB1 bacterium]|nr:hypothetical protein [candidate division KSB1 bacterium]
MIVWLIYAIHFFLHWYENKTIVMIPLEKPRLLKDPFFATLLWVIRLATHYGSVIGIWYLYGFGLAVGSYVVSYLFGYKTFNFYFNRAVHNALPYCIREIQKELKAKNINANENQIMVEAFKRAEKLITHVMKS